MKGEFKMGLLMTIDNGGTFTDACVIGNNTVISAKSLTTPHDLTKCFIEVMKQASKELYGKEDIGTLLNELEYLRYSTTAGTNAIVQKKGPRLGLILREGMNPSFLQESNEQQEMYSIMVGDRVSGINLSSTESDLEENIIKAVNELLSKGANRIIVSLSDPNLIEDEKKVKNIILRKYPRHLLGAVPMLISHELVDDRNDSKRTWGALINSFLHPGMERFLYNAENYLREHRIKNPLLIFQNDGNSARVAKTTAVKSYGSGPRGGMEGTKELAKYYNIPAMLTLDIGGTTSDIGLVKNKEIREDMHGKIEQIPTSFSLSDLISVGAGGSSIFKVVDGRITVGPDSVGASPGPACFARGGQEATITDAYLLMGILDSRSYFRGTMVLDETRAKTAIEENIAKPLGVSLEEALLLMKKAYEEKIAEGLALYQEQEKNITLLAFGGAGPMSACGVAEAANINKIIVPRLAAIFSAFGISFSDIAHEYQSNITELTKTIIEDKLTQLRERATRDMFAEGFDISECTISSHLVFSKDGEYEKMTFEKTSDILFNDIVDADEIRLHLKIEKPLAHFGLEENRKLKSLQPTLQYEKKVLNHLKQMVEVPVYRFDDLAPGMEGIGPALIEDQYFTCSVSDGWNFKINQNKDIFLTKEGGKME